MATNQPIKIQPRPNVKQINYVAKTFTDFRQNFIEFTKAYYPNTYADFNEASPGMMFIEMASYLGDVLSFYIDNAFKENLMAYAEQQDNIINIAQFLGYKPKLNSPAATTAELTFVVPATLSGSVYIPNPMYLPNIAAGSTFSTDDNQRVQFRLVEGINFADITDQDYVINQFDGSGNPLDFLIRKEVQLVAGLEKSVTLTFGSAQRFTKKVIDDTNVIGILNVTDSSDNKWYEVDYLAQDVVMDNVILNSDGEDGTRPAVGLKLKKVPRRFVTRINKDFNLEMGFVS